MRFLLRGVTGLCLFLLGIGLAAFGFMTFTNTEQSSGGWGRGGAGERSFTVKVSTLEPETITPEIHVFGEVRSWRTLELRAASAGRIQQIDERFRDGVEVAQGTFLLRLDPANAEAALADAELRMQRVQSELEEADARAENATAELDIAERLSSLRERSFTRQNRLASNGTISSATVEDAESALINAQQNVVTRRMAKVAAETGRKRLEHDLESARIARDQARRDLGDLDIRAPFAGLLSQTRASIGHRVSTNDLLGRLIDPQALEISFRLSNAQFSRLLGQRRDLIKAPITVKLDLGEEAITFPGQIERLAAEISEGNSGRLLYASVDDQLGLLRSGDFVSVQISEPELENVFVVPANALDSDGDLLLVNDENRLEEQTARILRRQGDTTIITDVPAGRTIVQTRQAQLGPGVLVKPVEESTGEGGNAALMASREGAPAQAPEPETIILEPAERAAMIERIKNSPMPDDRKTRILEQLDKEEVPKRLVERLRSRMGGGG